MILSLGGNPLYTAFRSYKTVSSRPRKIQNHVMAFVDENNKVSESTVSKKIPVSVSVPLRVQFGEHLRIVGSEESLGGWEIEKAPEMTCSEDGSVWSANLELSPSKQMEYKLVHVIPGRSPVWEFIDNRVLEITSEPLSLNLSWCDLEEDTGSSSDNIIKEYSEESVIDSSTAIAEVAQTEQEQEDITDSIESNHVSEITEVSSDGKEVGDDFIASAVDHQNNVLQLEANFMEKMNQEVISVPGADENVPESSLSEIATETAQNTDEEGAKTQSMIKKATKTAGYVALGVAGAAMLSALAVDVTDAAILGAVAAAAGGAAMNNGTKGSKASSEVKLDEEGNESTIDVQERKIKGAGEAGVVMAAGVLSAFDMGKSILSKKSDVDSTQETSLKVDEQNKLEENEEPNTE